MPSVSRSRIALAVLLAGLVLAPSAAARDPLPDLPVSAEPEEDDVDRLIDELELITREAFKFIRTAKRTLDECLLDPRPTSGCGL